MSQRSEREKFSGSSEMERQLDELGRESREMLQEASRARPDLADSESRFEARALESASRRGSGRMLPFFRHWAAAAAVLLLAGTAWFLWDSSPNSNPIGTYGDEIRLGEFSEGRSFRWDASGNYDHFNLTIYRPSDPTPIYRKEGILGNAHSLSDDELLGLPKGELLWAVEGANPRPGQPPVVSERKSFFLR